MSLQNSLYQHIDSKCLSSGSLLGDEIVFARVLTVIDVSLSQLSDLLVFGANLTSELFRILLELFRILLELFRILLELSSIFLSYLQIVVKHVDRFLLFRDGFLVLFRNLFDTVTDQPFDMLDELNEIARSN